MNFYWKNTNSQKERPFLKSGAGFTLIELLVVIAIIGILSAVGLIALNGTREKARDVTRKSDLKQLSTGLALFFDSNNDVYPDSSLNGVDTWTALAGAQKAERGDAAGCPACILYTDLVGNSKFMARLPNALAVGPTDLSKQYWYVSCAGKGVTDQTSATAFALITELERPSDPAKSWWVFSSTSSDAKEIAPTATPCN